MTAAVLLLCFLVASPAPQDDVPAGWRLRAEGTGFADAFTASWEGRPLLRAAFRDAAGRTVPFQLVADGPDRWRVLLRADGAAPRTVALVAQEGRLSLEPVAGRGRGLVWSVTVLDTDGARTDACVADEGSGAGHPLQLVAALDLPTRATGDVYLPEGDLLLHGSAPLAAAWPPRWDLPLDGAAWVAVEPAALARRNDTPWLAPMPERFPRPPSGWCSWYYFYRDVTPEAFLANARWMAEYLRPYGATVVQLDDGWQGEQGTDYGEVRDWDGRSPRFPEGTAPLARAVRELGMTPGLWLAPHGQSDPQVFRDHPEWWLRDADGNPVGSSWEGRYLLDPTSPGARAYLRDLFRRLRAEGWDYFKVDGQPIVLDLYRKLRDRFADPTRDPVVAWRETIGIVHDAIGDESYLLGCWGQPREGIGLWDGCRTGGDVVANWPGMRAALEATKSGLWLNGLAWWSDPDVLCVRPPLTLEEARTYATLFGLTGQALFASDDMPALGEDRVEVLRRVFPARVVLPRCLHPLEADPFLVDVRLADPAGGPTWDAVGLFAWGEEPTHHEFSFAGLGWERPDAPRIALDPWHRRYLGRFDDAFALTVAPHQVRLLHFRLAPDGDAPEVVLDFRHVLGALDAPPWRVARAAGAPGGARAWELTGVVDPPGDRRVLAVWVGRHDGAVPEVLSCTEVGADGDVALTWRREGPVLWLDLPPSASRARRLRLVLSGDAAHPPAPTLPELTLDADDLSVTLGWSWSGDSVRPPVEVWRDGRRLAVVAGDRWTDRGVPPAAVLDYELRAADDGRVLARLRGRTEPLGSHFLDELPLGAHEQGWGGLGRARSVDGHPLRIGGRTFTHGLGDHAPSRTEVPLHPGWTRFTATVGVDDEVGERGSVVFRILVDGEERWNSGLLRGGDPGVPVAVDLTGGRVLTLVTEPGPDGMDYDHADWADARLLVAADAAGR